MSFNANSNSLFCFVLDGHRHKEVQCQNVTSAVRSSNCAAISADIRPPPWLADDDRVFPREMEVLAGI